MLGGIMTLYCLLLEVKYGLRRCKWIPSWEGLYLWKFYVSTWPDIWSNITLGASMKVILVEINIWISRTKKHRVLSNVVGSHLKVEDLKRSRRLAKWLRQWHLLDISELWHCFCPAFRLRLKCWLFSSLRLAGLWPDCATGFAVSPVVYCSSWGLSTFIIALVNFL